ncbi:DoxX family protein [Prochlorococcus marinus XMU1419]|uniref:DoxX family protein n=1 Tax=Prochlorococcus marinus TaxID=1219 RepID=UPI001ADB6303|nr:DoxX family protein [Prochlorococcus marinus]MBO8234406.1 DoxX family protein [Prochlorococcus marinus XMU1419]MBW3076085.1 DoxX family membrane protein [Prochlorococcus marinus str. XMU1419]
MKIPNLKNKGVKSFLDFFSRVSISAIFISAIPGKINGFEKTVEYIASKGIPDPISSILLVGAIICLILGSGFFIFGENQKIGSIFLLLFLIPTTIIFHVFPFHQRAVLMNLGLIGGLIICALREP